MSGEMSDEKPTRVLMALDCGVTDADAFRAVSLLTGEPELEVTGVYIEDEDLINAARLPGIAEISTAGTVSALDPDSVQSELLQQAQHARQTFETSARRMNFNYSFRVSRGRNVDILLEAASTSDIVVVNRPLRAAGLRTRRGSHFAPLLEHHGNLLFVNEPWASGRSVIALCESPGVSSERALAAAKRIAAAEDLEFLVAVPPQQRDEQGVDADRTLILTDWRESAIVDLCESEDARLLVLSATHLNWQALLMGLIDRVSCSLLRLG